jgi:hypothetical protein
MASTFQKDDTFVIGITMAGAVSAGAYTAGVLDFLMEALSEWERAKLEADVPRHKVCLAAISGTSAGGVCAPLLCAALASGEAPGILRPGLTYAADEPALHAKRGDSLPVRVFLPRLYTAWVTSPALAAPDGRIDFLGDQDMKDGGPVLSALNAAMLESIGNTALFDKSEGQKRPPLSYVSQRLHLFTTLGNVTGIPYKIEFEGEPGSAHGMLLHADRIHSVVQGLGASALESIWASQEAPHLTVDPGLLFQGAPETNWAEVLLAALATCAFPLGMRARILKHKAHLWDKRLWPMLEGYDPKDFANSGAYPSMRPNWPAAISGNASADLEFVNVDGGVANNEPFEYARWSIMAKPGDANPADADEADRAVLMIDPFPEGPTFSALSQGKLSDDDRPDRLIAILKSLPGLLLDQARFKTTELVEAANPKKFSRFLISPSGPADSNNTNDFSGGARAMACGGLGGFGGFVSEVYRAYDFQLGRRNCQRFLSKHFALPDSNKLIKASWQGKETTAGWFKTPDSPMNGKQWCQIIPLTGTAAEEVPLPAWPKAKPAEIAEVRRRIGGRADKVVSRLLDEQFKSFTKYALKLGWTMLGGKAKSAIGDAVENGLKNRKQL